MHRWNERRTCCRAVLGKKAAGPVTNPTCITEGLRPQWPFPPLWGLRNCTMSASFSLATLTWFHASFGLTNLARSLQGGILFLLFSFVGVQHLLCKKGFETIEIVRDRGIGRGTREREPVTEISRAWTAALCTLLLHRVDEIGLQGSDVDEIGFQGSGVFSRARTLALALAFEDRDWTMGRDQVHVLLIKTIIALETASAAVGYGSNTWSSFILTSNQRTIRIKLKKMTRKQLCCICPKNSAQDMKI